MEAGGKAEASCPHLAERGGQRLAAPPADDSSEPSTTPIAGRPNSAPPYRGGLLKPTRASSARVKARLDAAKRQSQPAADNPSLSRPSSSNSARRARVAESEPKRAPVRSREASDQAAAATAPLCTAGAANDSGGPVAAFAGTAAVAEPANSVELKAMTVGALVVETPQVTAAEAGDTAHGTAMDANPVTDRVLEPMAGGDAVNTTHTLGPAARSEGDAAGLSDEARAAAGTDTAESHNQVQAAVRGAQTRPKSVPAGGRAAAMRTRGEFKLVPRASADSVYAHHA